MRCPRGDGELVQRSVTGLGGIPIKYHLCLGCLGHWIGAFDANYFPVETLSQADLLEPPELSAYRCPICFEPLERAHSDAIAPDVAAWYCTAGHGYYFPKGNLRKFRTALEARVNYHRLWQIPTASVRSVLLTSLILFMLVTSGILVTQMSRSQQSESQAQAVISGRQVIISDGNVAIFVQTSAPSQIRLIIDELGVDKPMTTNDGLLHQTILEGLSPGTYIFRLLFSKEGKVLESPIYDFYVPNHVYREH